MHRSCAARYFQRLSNKKNTYPCPTCKQEWNKKDVDSVLKGTKKTDENDGRLSNGTGNKKQRTSTRRVAAEQSDDDDE